MRWVIVAVDVTTRIGVRGPVTETEVTVIGPGRNRTYPSSERARHDADQMGHEHDDVQVVQVKGILDD